MWQNVHETERLMFYKVIKWGFLKLKLLLFFLLECDTEVLEQYSTNRKLEHGKSSQLQIFYCKIFCSIFWLQKIA